LAGSAAAFFGPAVETFFAFAAEGLAVLAVLAAASGEK
jgi:hypothetical protein